jgi:diacylglycerol kinase family enzyme
MSTRATARATGPPRRRARSDRRASGSGTGTAKKVVRAPPAGRRRSPSGSSRTPTRARATPGGSATRCAARARRCGRSTSRPSARADDVDVDGLDRIVAAGGDGTVGPAARLASSTGLPLAVVATGTANSFARWLELPLDADDAARLAARPQAVLRTVEVADACGRPFVNVAATGLSVLAAHGARPLKKPLGPAAYAVGALRAGLTGRPLHTAVRCDGELAWRGDAWQVLVAATGAFGGDSATGGVDTADRRLDVAIVPAGPRRRLAARALAMRRRELVHEDEVTHVRGRVVELELPAGHPFNVDGEILDLERARFSVLGTLGWCARDAVARGAAGRSAWPRPWAAGTPATRCATAARRPAARATSCTATPTSTSARASSCGPPRSSPAHPSPPATTSTCSSTATRSSRGSWRRSARRSTRSTC